MAGYVISIDVGGTFTDCVVIGETGRATAAKARSTPSDNFKTGFFASIEAAAAQLGLDPTELLRDTVRISHGSTVATNIMVQRGGASVGLITTKGHEDTLRLAKGMGRIHGEPAENLLHIAKARRPVPLVPAERAIGVTERVDVDGDVVIRLDEDEARAAIARLAEAGVEAIACGLLWSFANPVHELRIRELIAEAGVDVFVSLSHEVSPSLGEFERFTSAAINSIVGPTTASYLADVEAELARRRYDGPFQIMQCNGGTTTPRMVRRYPIMMIGSGPVGGLTACAQACEQIGSRNIIATDMGGTSFEVGLIVDGAPLVQEETVVDKYVYRIPKLDVTSIAAGGGSIAWIDEINGTLQVGPRSAGADPGPACYGFGGTEPTVTDANLLIGYIDPETTFGSGGQSGFRLDRDAAHAAVEALAKRVGLPTLEVARGIVDIIENKMAALIGNEVIGRGFDPRDFVAAAYGGAGPLHAYSYAAELGLRSVYIPGRLAPFWSAYGISSSDVRHSLEQNLKMLPPFDVEALAEVLAAPRGRARELLAEEGFAEDAMRFEHNLRMRYEGQGHDLRVPVPAGRLDADAMESVVERFNALYEERYGPATQLPEARVEIVSATCEGFGDVPKHPRRPGDKITQATPNDARKPSREVYWDRGGTAVSTPVFDGLALAEDALVSGPALIDLPDTTVVIRAGQQVHKNAYGDYELFFEREARHG
ncbi:MAG: hydantoinase/oxoprolinase family protein [Pseudonocardia sp.]|nr:hydantoinase/oxoprolinase family protein [Pseudonocardia sp.]